MAPELIRLEAEVTSLYWRCHTHLFSDTINGCDWRWKPTFIGKPECFNGSASALTKANWTLRFCSSRESPVDCSVTKRSRHVSDEEAPMLYQSSYQEPRVSPQTTTPPSSATEEKRVIVPAGEPSHEPLPRTHRHKTPSCWLANKLTCATVLSEAGTALVCHALPQTDEQSPFNHRAAEQKLSGFKCQHDIRGLEGTFSKVWFLKCKFRTHAGADV